MSFENPSTSSQAAISQIACNNIAGAAEILFRAARVYSLLIEERRNCECSSAGHAMQKVLEASLALLEAQPGMASLARLATAVLDSATGCTHANETLDHADGAARSFAETAACAAAAAAEHAADLIPDGARVLTHSRSSTVLLALRLALKARKRIEVIVTESRPIMEGRILATELSREGASVTLIADAAAAHALRQAGLVLLGADHVSTSDVVNKIGTRLIALAAREGGKPVHVVCDTFKFIGTPQLFRGDWRRQDRSELWSDAPDEVEILNTYFEPTPLALFTSIITERGAARPEEAARLAERFGLHHLLEATAIGT